MHTYTLQVLDILNSTADLEQMIFHTIYSPWQYLDLFTNSPTQIDLRSFLKKELNKDDFPLPDNQYLRQKLNRDN